MRVLFVHGMGRSALSGWPMLLRLKRAGLKIGTFSYVVTLEDFSAIKERLVLKLRRLATQGDYVLIGHSLGGVLLRAAVNSLPVGTKPPQHIFLLGSPIHSVQLAKKLRKNLFYRSITRDCGQLLGSKIRMSKIGAVSIPTTSIVGVCGLPSKNGDRNDGVVSVSEVSAEWIVDQVRIPTVHTLLPANKRVAQVVLDRITGT